MKEEGKKKKKKKKTRTKNTNPAHNNSDHISQEEAKNRTCEQYPLLVLKSVRKNKSAGFFLL
jgi:hypothetical protein